MKTDRLASIHVAHWGNTGPRVIMIHGGVQGSSSAGERNFQAQKPLAEQGWRLLIPDRPGHGASLATGRGDDAEKDSLWVADMLEDGAHLVGHSFGGLVALLTAASRPSRIHSLTLIEPALHKIAIRDPAVCGFVFNMAFTMLTSFSAATRARRAVP